MKARELGAKAAAKQAQPLGREVVVAEGVRFAEVYGSTAVLGFGHGALGSPGVPLKRDPRNAKRRPPRVASPSSVYVWVSSCLELGAPGVRSRATTSGRRALHKGRKQTNETRRASSDLNPFCPPALRAVNVTSVWGRSIGPKRTRRDVTSSCGRRPPRGGRGVGGRAAAAACIAGARRRCGAGRATRRVHAATGGARPCGPRGRRPGACRRRRGRPGARVRRAPSRGARPLHSRCSASRCSISRCSPSRRSSRTPAARPGNLRQGRRARGAKRWSAPGDPRQARGSY